MKNKIHKILGVGITLVIAMALVMGFVAPVAASPGETINEWYTFDYPAEGAAGDWFRMGSWDNDERINKIGPIAEAINGDLYTYVELMWPSDDGDDHIFKSEDGGRSWADTGYTDVEVCGVDDHPDRVRDMVCSSIDEDIVYATDGGYVYKTTDGGDTWDFVKRDSLEEQLGGACGCCLGGGPECARSMALWDPPITSIDVAYDDNDNPFVFIGTRAHEVDYYDDGACSECIDGSHWDYPGSVYFIGEAGYPSSWTDLNLSCFSTGDYDALAVGCAPDWADTKETYVVVSSHHQEQTFVVTTTGGPCDWPEYAELFWDCDSDNYDDILYASRIAFPDDFEDTGTLFVGVVDDHYCPGDMGDVYMVMDGSAYDMNVLGISSGCIGLEAVDIISLDIEGDTEEARLIAGAFCDTNVYCSEDGGWSWDASAKDPTGEERAYVIWYEDTALAATWYCECAVSMCCGEDYPCEFWNQISLIATRMQRIEYLGFSPGYVCEGSETMFMLSKWEWAECDYEDTSLWRYDGTYWERVFLGFYDAPWDEADSHIDWVFVSPDFNDTSTLYVASHKFGMWRSTDAGCSWTQLSFPCTPRTWISAVVVIDEDTVIAGGQRTPGPVGADDGRGYVYKTTRHGARPWDEYEFDATHEGDVVSFALEPGYEDPGSVLLGDDESGVYISEDGGETWDMVGDPLTVFDTEEDAWVIFDPAYATSGIIYAAAGNNIARCVIDPDADWADQTWEEICDGIVEDASGIAAAGDTALYVTDDECTDDDTDGEECPCCDDGVADEGGVLRSLNPDADDAADVIFERLVVGLPANVPPDNQEAELYELFLTCDTSDEGCAENVLWALDKEDRYYLDPGYYYPKQNVWVWEDTLAAPVVLAMPVDAQKLGTTDSATLSWNELCGADCYEVALWKYCAECPDQKLVVPLDLDCAPGECCIACAPEAAEDLCACPAGECACTTDTCIVVDGLEPGCEYYWQVRVCLCKPFLSKWSEERTFMTALVPVVDLCSPVCGGQDIILTPNFSWDAVEGATGYDIELATTETFTAGVVRGSSTVNAWVAPEDLEYATTYYWRVRAEKDGVFSDWTVCIFTTMEKPVAPPPPVTITPAPPAPQINIPPAKMITPNWIYAVIGIGAALCVVVIVLIVRTRRPPA